MSSYPLETIATDGNFDEVAYLASNPDVAAAVQDGSIKSAYAHFQSFGKKEKRFQRDWTGLLKAKAVKLARLRPLLRTDVQFLELPNLYDFLTDDLRNEFRIVGTDAISSNNYDGYALQFIEKHTQGLILDCGAGRRSIYYDNVVNLEIVDYDSTDVRGVSEVLPFRNDTFSALEKLREY